jgi:molybdate transport system substrate-binding protein
MGEDTMLNKYRLRVLFAGAFLLLPVLASPAAAAEVKVLSANALSPAEKALAADFTKETGHTVTFVFGTPADINNHLKAGEAYDLVIMPAEAAVALDKEGKWRAGTLRKLARVGIGLAVREGTKLDLSTVESTRKALLDARSLTLSDSGTGGLSGPNAQKVLANLGITDAVKGKLKPTPNGQDLIGMGEIEIGLYNASEIPRAKGVVLAGAVPAAVQVYINYDAAIPATNAAPENALALLKYFSQPASSARWTAAGLGLAGD